jgi:hypothetical protein
MESSTFPLVPSVPGGWGRLRRGIPGALKGLIRRRADNLFPTREAREYCRWRAERLEQRRHLFRGAVEAGLLSVLTPVWNGSPVRYLKPLAESLINQNQAGACEWVILDNGCSQPDLVAYLQELSRFTWVKLHKVEKNIGIVRGLRYCLERASGRYVLSVDADDYLYEDALVVIASYIRESNYPPLLYSDEDKVIETRFYQPYFKPDWDPVLLLNSAYIAHLGVVERDKALALGAYDNERTEGSPDWDIFIKFLIAGYSAVHIPEVLYSWRVHARSTADHTVTKPYVHSSQKAVLQHFLEAQPDPQKFELEHNSFGNHAQWHFRRQPESENRFVSVVLGNVDPQKGAVLVGTSHPEIGSFPVELAAHPRDLLSVARETAQQDGFVQFVGVDVAIENPEWPSEALGLFELHPDTVMAGGRIRHLNGTILEAGRYFGFGGPCGCPDRGRTVADPGYFMQMWKQRSVSAVATQFAVMKAAFLLDLLEHLPDRASLAFLGAWAGARAAETGKRVVYSPFLSGLSTLDWEMLIDPAEKELFSETNRHLIPDRRFYSPHFSLETPFALLHPSKSRDQP